MVWFPPMVRFCIAIVTYQNEYEIYKTQLHKFIKHNYIDNIFYSIFLICKNEGRNCNEKETVDWGKSI